MYKIVNARVKKSTPPSNGITTMRKLFNYTILLLLFSSIGLPLNVYSQTLKNGFYRLTTQWLGEGKSLDIVNDGTNDKVQMANSTDASGQSWKVTSIGNGYYRLTTEWLGEEKSLGANDGAKVQLQMQKTAKMSGQYWKITSLGSGYYRFTNQWLGGEQSLGVANEGAKEQLQMQKTAKMSGQFWKMNPLSLEEEVSKLAAVPAQLGLDPFYQKYLNARGIPIISSSKVPDAALWQAKAIVEQMLAKIPTTAIRKLVQHKIRVAVMSKDEVTTDIPEHRNLNQTHPADENWDTRARGLGATIELPVTSCAEENLLCYADDGYLGEDILIHEFAHTIHLGLELAFSDFDNELKRIYEEAMQKGLWLNLYAGSNHHEYFAEGAQTWFNVNKEAIPADGIHNHINTRNELKTYDPKLYALLRRYFSEDTKKISCQVGK